MKKMYETLFDLTGHESGIIVRGKTVMVYTIIVSQKKGFPVLSPFGEIMAYPTESMILLNSRRDVSDVRKELPGEVVSRGVDDDGKEIAEVVGMDVVCDCNFDIPAMFGFDISEDGSADIYKSHEISAGISGVIYDVTLDGENAKLVVPDFWN